MHAYFGGTAAVGADWNFTNVCFTGCTTSSTVKNLSDLGFVDVTSAMNINGTTADPTGANIPINTTIDFTGNQNDGAARYLVMTGALGSTLDSNNDYFKVSMIQASQGLKTLPEPGTLALLGLGLFGLIALKRRPALAWGTL